MYPLTYQLARLKIDEELRTVERERLVRAADGQARTVVVGPRWLRERLGRLFGPVVPTAAARSPRPAGA